MILLLIDSILILVGISVIQFIPVNIVFPVIMGFLFSALSFNLSILIISTIVSTDNKIIKFLLRGV